MCIGVIILCLATTTASVDRRPESLAPLSDGVQDRPSARTGGINGHDDTAHRQRVEAALQRAKNEGVYLPGEACTSSIILALIQSHGTSDRV